MRGAREREGEAEKGRGVAVSSSWPCYAPASSLARRGGRGQERGWAGPRQREGGPRPGRRVRFCCFLFFFLFSVFCFALVKIPKHFIKCPKSLCGLIKYRVSHS